MKSIFYLLGGVLILTAAFLTIESYKHEGNLDPTTNERTITITSIYPDGNLKQTDFFTIRGDQCSLNWNSGLKMTKKSSNTYSIQLTCTSSSVSVLAFKILKSDSAWTIGPNFMIDLTNTSKSSYTVYPYFTAGVGTFELNKRIYSLKLLNFRSMIVYLPASYKENTLKQYDNILIMHDGQNLFDPSTAFMGQAWMVQDTVNKMIGAGNMEDLIIAGVYNTNGRMQQYTYSYDSQQGFGGKGDVYLDFIQNDIIPLLLEKYRINKALPKGVAMIGSSLGGLISCYAGWTRSQTFKKVGCMSSSFWWNDEDFNNKIILQKDSKFNSNIKIYLDSGDSGDSLDDRDQTIRVRETLKSKWNFDSNHLFYYLD